MDLSITDNAGTAFYPLGSGTLSWSAFTETVEVGPAPEDSETITGAQAKVDAHVNDTTAAHAASAISYGAGDVEEALDAHTAGVYVDTYIAAETPAGLTTAIQAAATAAGDDGTIIFGPRTYTHAGLSFDQNGLTLKGAGRGETILQSTAGTTVDAIKINTTGSFKNPFSIEEMDVLGVAGSGHGINVRYASVVTIQNVRSSNHGGDGIRTFETTLLTMQGVECRDNAGNGFTGGQKQDAGSFVGCSFFSNDGWGVDLGSGARNNGNHFAGCLMSNNTLGGIRVLTDTTNGTIFSSCYIETNLVQAVLLGDGTGGVSPTIFDGCYFAGDATGPLGIDAFNVYGLHVRGCFFEGFPTGAVKVRAATPTFIDGSNCSVTGYQLQDNNATNHNFSGGRTVVLAGNNAGPIMVSTAIGIVPFAVRSMSGQTAALQEWRNSSGTATSKVRADGTLKIGTTGEGATADLNIARNDAVGQALARFEQQGAGVASTPIVHIAADGTTTSAYALFVRSKGTGRVAAFVDASATILEVHTGAKLGFFGVTPVTQRAANPDTSGATLAALETEVNELKAALRSLGLIAT